MKTWSSRSLRVETGIPRATGPQRTLRAHENVPSTPSSERLKGLRVIVGDSLGREWSTSRKAQSVQGYQGATVLTHSDVWSLVAAIGESVKGKAIVLISPTLVSNAWIAERLATAATAKGVPVFINGSTTVPVRGARVLQAQESVLNKLEALLSK